MGERNGQLQQRLQRLPPEPQRNARSTTWLAPATGKTAYEPKDADWRSFATLAEFQKATGQEAHGIEVDYDIFENMTPPDPARRYNVYHAMDLNFRLNPNGKGDRCGRAAAHDQ